ncbi:MAG: SUMF1/EgtB/PvdO family nonheme iron enzyme [Planctomycetes bacterium]|nr:SUMF1/EgtB/PvdO family nonheme iron enzyme [Planctomycetota bacterium]MBL7039159.1 SUMF1/EgtB/PvdO family nonheme iron enzyme [Pirellulaceae bacterium]
MTASFYFRLTFAICLLVGPHASLCEGIDVTQNATDASITELRDRIEGVNFPALRMAIRDLAQSFPSRYLKGEDCLAELDAIQPQRGEILDGLARGDTKAITQAKRLLALEREALEANPLLDFDRLLLVRRRPIKDGQPGDVNTCTQWDVGLPRSSTGNSTLVPNVHDNCLVMLSPVSPQGKLTTVFAPDGPRCVTDVDLHFDAQRALFSMRDDNGAWQIYEIGTDGTDLRQVSRGEQTDVDNYDACYLADGRILFGSSACFQAVPCNGSHVALLYRMEADGSGVRQLSFDQDHSFNPVMMPSGRVMYLRWEYSDLPHAHSRMMFTMNPDGTDQRAHYGSNSYWPNSIFGARPIPSDATKFVGIVNGHHGSHREGELVLFDVALGRHEADGAVQRIPGWGRTVEPIIRDELTVDSWPKFVHPYPLSDKYFLVSAKPTPTTPWDLFLVDVFGNRLLVHHADGYGLFEPIPIRETPVPKVIPDRIDLSNDEGMVHIADMYQGPGLQGVPRGTVKRLRVYSLHFAYQGKGGLLGVVGLDGPWDVRRILGTVPVEADGSAHFRVPANTPVAIQPLDSEGKAVQLMRSWFVAMPGETVSCVGCHTSENAAPLAGESLALDRSPSEIATWYGPARNFSFKREVQPVIDRNCVGCHDGRAIYAGTPLPDLRGSELTSDYKCYVSGNTNSDGGRFFSVGYFELSKLVRRPGIESDMHLLMPMEFHANTTQLVQMLQKGHYGVELEAESWDRLITWIDLNTPYHGTWTETGIDPGRQRQRRRDLRNAYAGVDEDPESLASVSPPAVESLPPPVVARSPDRATGAPQIPDWPFDAAEARRRQLATGLPERRTVELADGIRLQLALIPGGDFLMGDDAGQRDERPVARVSTNAPFWMGVCEITNEQYARFDPSHDSHVESRNAYQFGVHGFSVDGPKQPVVRVSWQRAMAFSRWLAERTGEPFTLPTEAQWEYACRAGTNTPFSYGGVDEDFSPYANLADVKLRSFFVDPYKQHELPRQITKYDDWIPRDTRFDDSGLVTVAVGSYRPNAWQLHDMHGNVAEWTLTSYRPYPYDANDGREDGAPLGEKAVRGGSWRDRPKHCRSAFRRQYPSWQGVYNVGFRVACPANARGTDDVARVEN